MARSDYHPSASDGHLLADGGNLQPALPALPLRWKFLACTFSLAAMLVLIIHAKAYPLNSEQMPKQRFLLRGVAHNHREFFDPHRPTGLGPSFGYTGEPLGKVFEGDTLAREHRVTGLGASFGTQQEQELATKTVVFKPHEMGVSGLGGDVNIDATQDMTFIKWFVSSGDDVQTGEAIMLVNVDGQEIEFQAARPGLIGRMATLKLGDIIHKGDVMVVIEHPSPQLPFVLVLGFVLFAIVIIVMAFCWNITEPKQQVLPERSEVGRTLNQYFPVEAAEVTAPRAEKKQSKGQDARPGLPRISRAAANANSALYL